MWTAYTRWQAIALKIDLLAVDSVVKTSQMQDAVHRGVLDAAHYVPAYWYSKSKAASLVRHRPLLWLVLAGSSGLGQLWRRSGAV